LEKKSATISCRVEEAEDIKGCAWRREREGSRREGTGGLYHAGICEALRRYLRTSTSNCVGLGRLEQGKNRGQREERGGFIGEVFMALNSRGKSVE
jgi:hypothetical protein